jgi:hypothetical protein
MLVLSRTNRGLNETQSTVLVLVSLTDIHVCLSSHIQLTEVSINNIFYDRIKQNVVYETT